MRAASFDSAKGVWTQTVPQKEFYSVQDVGVLLDVGGPAIYQAVNRGTLPGYRVNGVVSVKHDDLVAYISRRRTGETLTIGEFTVERIEPRAKAEADAEDMGVGDLENGDDLDFLE